MFITEAMAAAETAAAVEPSPMAGFILQLILVFAIFYFLLIRPQQKKMKEQRYTVNDLTHHLRVNDIDSISKVIEDNIEKSFKIFSLYPFRYYFICIINMFCCVGYYSSI